MRCTSRSIRDCVPEARNEYGHARYLAVTGPARRPDAGTGAHSAACAGTALRAAADPAALAELRSRRADPAGVGGLRDRRHVDRSARRLRIRSAEFAAAARS